MMIITILTVIRVRLRYHILFIVGILNGGSSHRSSIIFETSISPILVKLNVTLFCGSTPDCDGTGIGWHLGGGFLAAVVASMAMATSRTKLKRLCLPGCF